MQPDAANFNSWRRHIKLSANPPDEVMFAWEDVKAMFNGGSRKRAMAASLTSVSKQQQQKRQQQQQQQQASRILMSEEMDTSSSPMSFAPTPVKRSRHSPSSPAEGSSSLLTAASSEAKTSPTSSSSSSGSCGGLSNSHLSGAPYPFPLIPLHGNKAYGALIQGLAPTPFPHSSLTHLSSSPRPPAGPASPHAFKASLSPDGSQQHDVRQSFAELMGTSLLLPYNYFQLSRYWPPRPPTAAASPQILDMSSARQRLALGLSDAADGLASAAALTEKVLLGSSEVGQAWGREQGSQRSGLSHGGSAFKPVSKNLGPANVSSAKGSAFRAENLISNCTRSCSPADSARSEDEENEVDVIGGEEDGMRDKDRSGRRRRDSTSSPSPLQSRTESSSQSEAFEVRLLSEEAGSLSQRKIACKYLITGSL